MILQVYSLRLSRGKTVDLIVLKTPFLTLRLIFLVPSRRLPGQRRWMMDRGVAASRRCANRPIENSVLRSHAKYAGRESRNATAQLPSVGSVRGLGLSAIMFLSARDPKTEMKTRRRPDWRLWSWRCNSYTGPCQPCRRISSSSSSSRRPQ
jgi:hypothetical protein